MLDLTGTFAAGPVFQGVTGTPALTIAAPRTGASMGYYSNGFVGAGSNQTGLSLSGVLGGVLSGLESVFHFPTSTSGSVGATPPIVAPTVRDIPAANQHPVLTGAGGASGKGTATAVGVGTAIAGGIAGLAAPRLVGLGGGHAARYAPAGTKGYHMIKRGPHAGLWTRNRHRNVANIRALRRALSRAHGFERICRKVMHFVHPGRRGRAVFRKRRRSK